MKPRKTLVVLLGLVAAWLLVAPGAASAASFGIEDFTAATTTSQAGGHPDLTTTVTLPSEPGKFPGISRVVDNTRSITVELPPGFVGDPSALPECTEIQFALRECPIASQVGFANTKLIGNSGEGPIFGYGTGLYNLQPRNADTVAELGFTVIAVQVFLQVKVRSDGNYGLTVESPGVSAGLSVIAAEITTWGVPADPSHDSQRNPDLSNTEPESDQPLVPFFTNPTTCGGPLTFHAAATSYQAPEVKHEAVTTLPPITGCDQLEFHPGLKARPTTNRTDAPSGLNVSIDLPQHDSVVGHSARQRLTVAATEGQFKLGFGGQTTADLASSASAGDVQAALEGLSSIGAGNVTVTGGAGSEDGSTPYKINFGGALAFTNVEELSVSNGTEPLKITNGSGTRAGSASVETVINGSPRAPVGEESATPALRDATVTLPKGLVINPSSANGLGACSQQQIGLLPPGGEPGLHFDTNVPSCPESSNLGKVKVFTPVFDDPLEGSVYLATPHDNPFGSLLALYLTVEGHGLHIKLAGKVSADPENGQLTSTFTENPQLPVEHLQLELNPGALGPLRTPAACGTYTSTSVLTPWSAPQSGPSATPSDTYAITGGSCTEAAASPSFQAGAVSAIAGAYSPFVLSIERADGSSEITGLDDTLPPGLLAKLAGVAYCSDADLAAAAAKDGRAEQASPSCPGASQVGVVTVGAGAGPKPFYANGKAYLAGPYKGAPISLAVVVPAVAGPFDLGTVMVRTALYVDPVTAQVRAVSDAFPHILQGIPVDVRSVELRMDRGQFTRNPTSCDPFAVTGSAALLGGGSAPTSSRFQVAECGRLAFKPKLSIAFTGAPPRRGGLPALKATLTAPDGSANIGSAAVILPGTELLEQSHIRTICTRVQWDAGTCPKGSIYGYARAITPLLEKPLEGPVYLRSNGGARELPDLVADLRGQIDVELTGYIDTVKRHGIPRIRTRFVSVPDAPVTKFVLNMQGRRKGLLVNNTNLCKAKPRVNAEFGAQNGKLAEGRPRVKVAHCRPKHK
jgi:hypothetical protein